MFQRNIGNQAMIRLLTERATAIRNMPGTHEKENDAGHMAAEAAAPSCDLSAPRLPAPIQAKLRVGAVDDPLEHEADRVADQVMQMPASGGGLISAPPQVNRKCAACEPEEEEKLQRKEAGTTEGAASEAPASVHGVLRSGGQPLDAATRAYFEPRFGHDFNRVRIHCGSLAEDSAAAIGALAYTVGHNIVFNAGRYAPSTEPGRKLLAHELAHVMQQNTLGHFSTTAAPMLAPLTRVTQPLLSRAPAPGHCGGSWTCSAVPCEQPDQVGQGTPSTTWELDVNIDTDVAKSTDINTPNDVGHASANFRESNGTQYSFGFYPQPNLPPTEFVSMVPGCVAHPDTTHVSCFDYTEHYTLSQQQYNDALRFAQAYCISPLKYALFTNNCTTFVVEVAKKAGQNPPSPRGPVLEGTKQSDNPNTLKEGYLDRHFPTRNLTSDTEIRNWVSAHNTSDIAALLTEEKIRLLNRLLDGVVSDEDVTAFERICGSVDTSGEQLALQKALGPREQDLWSPPQRDRIHKALFIVIDAPAPAPGAAQG